MSEYDETVECWYCTGPFEQNRQSNCEHIMISVALFGGALAGAFDAKMRALMTAWIKGDQAARVVLFDLVKQRGLATGQAQWGEEQQEWSRVDKHGTGDNPHVWFPVAFDFQCTCGMLKGDEHRPRKTLTPAARARLDEMRDRAVAEALERGQLRRESIALDAADALFGEHEGL